ncbi:hypothetical protein [Vibrio phage phiKT1028]|nr:hypothetical protein [Vibrio phage phiKT1028]
MTTTIESNLNHPIELTIKRDDDQPDSTVVTNPDGSWEMDIGPVATSRKVKFSFYHGEQKAGEHSISFINAPVSAEILSGAYPVMAFDQEATITYQLKDADGNNYVGSEGEFIKIESVESGYVHLDIPIPTNGIIEIPWSKTSVGSETHVLKNGQDGTLNEYTNEYVVVGDLGFMYHDEDPKLGEPWTLFGYAMDRNDVPIAGLPIHVYSLTEEYPYDETLTTDERGLISILLDPPESSEEFDVELEMSAAGQTDDVYLTWADYNDGARGFVELDPTPSEVAEADGITLTGVVKDEGGNPIPNGRVHFYRLDPGNSIYHNDTYTTDGDGRFSFDTWIDMGKQTFFMATDEHFVARDIAGFVSPEMDMLQLGGITLPYLKDSKVSVIYRDKFGNLEAGKTITFRYDSDTGPIAGTVVTDENGLAEYPLVWDEVQDHTKIYAISDADTGVSIIEKASINEVVPENLKIINAPARLHPYQKAFVSGFLMGSDGKPYKVPTQIKNHWDDFNWTGSTESDADGYFEISFNPMESTSEDGSEYFLGINQGMSRIKIAWDDGKAGSYQRFRFDAPDFPNGIGPSQTITLNGKMRDDMWNVPPFYESGALKLIAKVYVDGDELSSHNGTVRSDGTFIMDITTPATMGMFEVWLTTEDGNHADRIPLWVGGPMTKSLTFTRPTPETLPPNTTYIDVAGYFRDENNQPIVNQFVTIYVEDPRFPYPSVRGSGITDEDGFFSTQIFNGVPGDVKITITAERYEASHLITVV